MICLLPEKIKEFKKALKERFIKIEDLINMDSDKRTELFKKYAGENAKDVNLLFEKKLVLKNRILGIKNLMSKLGEIGRYDPEKKAKLVELMEEYKKKQEKRIFNPKEDESFLMDLAEEKLGVRISEKEAQIIFDLSKKADDIKSEFYNPDTGWKNKKSKLEYGLTKAFKKRYIEDLRGNTLPLKKLLGSRYSEFRQLLKENKFEAANNLIGDVIKTTNDASISAVASVDGSFIGRQGFKVLLNGPKIWWNGARNSVIDAYKTLRGKNIEVQDALWADIYSNPNYIEGRMQKAKIIPMTEEQFPTSLPERIPVAGKVFNASENAFVGSALRMRVGLFDKLLEIRKSIGENIDSPEVLKDTGKFVNSMTARGSWGKLSTGGEVVRLFIWAPKMLKSAIDTLAMPFYSDVSPFIRKRSAIVLLSYISAIALIKGIAWAIDPNSIENDPRSTDFKNIKFGNTRFSIGIGEMTLITLASRLLPTKHKGEWGFWTKNSVGIYKKSEGLYGEATPFDALINFSTNKTTPAARTLVDYLKRRTIEGKPPTAISATYRLTTPISIQNTIQLEDDNSADAIAGVMADVIGISADTYTYSSIDWNQKPGKELQQFKEKIGEEEFKNANDKYNNKVNTMVEKALRNNLYKNASDEKKQEYIDYVKDKIKQGIFDDYNFKYEKGK